MTAFAELSNIFLKKNNTLLLALILCNTNKNRKHILYSEVAMKTVSIKDVFSKIVEGKWQLD